VIAANKLKSYTKLYIMPLLIILGVSTISSIAFLRYPFSAGDVRAHMVKIWYTSEMIRHGKWSWWCPIWYCGIPFLLYYPPLFYIEGALVNLILHNPINSIRVMGIISVYILAIGVFFISRKLQLSIGKSILSSLILMTTPSILWEINRGGIYPMMMSLGLGLIGLGSMISWLSSKKLKYLILYVIMMSLSLYTHPIGGLTCYTISILVVVSNLYLNYESSNKSLNKKRIIKDIEKLLKNNWKTLAVTVSIPLLSAPQYLPMFIYRHYLSPLYVPPPSFNLAIHLLNMIGCAMWSPLLFLVIAYILGSIYGIRYGKRVDIKIFGLISILSYVVILFLPIYFNLMTKIAPGGQLLSHRLSGVIFPVFGSVAVAYSLSRNKKDKYIKAMILAIALNSVIYSIYIYSYLFDVVSFDKIESGYCPKISYYIWSLLINNKYMKYIISPYQAFFATPRDVTWGLITGEGLFSIKCSLSKSAKKCLEYIRSNDSDPYNLVIFDPFTHVSPYFCDSAYTSIISKHYSLMGWFNQGSPAFYSLPIYVEWQYSWMFYKPAVFNIFFLANVKYVISRDKEWNKFLHSTGYFKEIRKFGKLHLYKFTYAIGPCKIVPNPILVIDDCSDKNEVNKYYTMMLNLIPMDGWKHIFVQGNVSDASKFHQIVVRVKYISKIRKIVNDMKRGKLVIIIPYNDWILAEEISKMFHVKVKPVKAYRVEPIQSMYVSSKVTKACKEVGMAIPGSTEKGRMWFLINGKPFKTLTINHGRIKVMICGIDIFDYVKFIHPTLGYGIGDYPVPKKDERTLIKHIFGWLNSGTPKPAKMKADTPSTITVYGHGYIILNIGYHPLWSSNAGKIFRGSGGLIVVKSSGRATLKFKYKNYERIIWWGMFALGLIAVLWVLLSDKQEKLLKLLG